MIGLRAVELALLEDCAAQVARAKISAGKVAVIKGTIAQRFVGIVAVREVLVRIGCAAFRFSYGGRCGHDFSWVERKKRVGNVKRPAILPQRRANCRLTT